MLSKLVLSLLILTASVAGEDDLCEVEDDFDEDKDSYDSEDDLCEVEDDFDEDKDSYNINFRSSPASIATETGKSVGWKDSEYENQIGSSRQVIHFTPTHLKFVEHGLPKGLFSSLQDPVDNVIIRDPQSGPANDVIINDGLPPFVARIVGGNNASPGQFPYQASLRFELDNKIFVHFCGGVLIGRNTVLTAAHCVSGFDLKRIVVVLGDNRLSSTDNTEQIFRICRAYIHPSYNVNRLQNDLAILTLSGKVCYTETVKPVKLARPGQNFVRSSCVLSGWGATRGGGPASDILQFASSTAISNEECSRYFSNIFGGILCFLSDNRRRGACSGDSGGPAVCDGVLAGITSFGIRNCPPTAPSAYTRISYYYNFIRRRLENDK